MLARRQGANWYVAAINATKETLKLEVQLPEAFANKTVHYYYDNNDRTPATKDVSIKKDGKLKLTLPTDGGAVITDQQ